MRGPIITETMLRTALRDGNCTTAAYKLGVSTATVSNLCAEYGIEVSIRRERERRPLRSMVGLRNLTPATLVQIQQRVPK